MAYQDQFYTAGKATVTNNSTAVTGSETGWATALVTGGIFFAGGGAYPILSVDGETALTLAIPYTGASAANVDYAIDRQRAAAISNIAMNDRLAEIIHDINIGNIEKLNALELDAHQILQTDAAGDLTTLTLAARQMLQADQNGALTALTVAARQILQADGSGALKGLTVGARQILQSDAAGALQLVNLIANRILRTDANGDIQQSPVTTAALDMLASSTPVADSLGYTPVNKAGDSGLGGYSATLQDLGNTSGLTITPSLSVSNFQMLTNNGAFTLSAPATMAGMAADISILVKTATGAGAMTASGFAKVNGTFAVAKDQMLTISIRGSSKILTIMDAS